MNFPKIDSTKRKNNAECFKIFLGDIFDFDSEGVQIAGPGDCTRCEAWVVVCPEHAIWIEEM